MPSYLLYKVDQKDRRERKCNLTSGYVVNKLHYFVTYQSDNLSEVLSVVIKTLWKQVATWQGE